MVLVGYEIRVTLVSNSFNVERFVVRNLMSYYGSRNVSLKRLQASEAVYRHVKTIARYFAISSLTEKKLEVISKAFLEGFFLERRSAGLSSVAESLGLSKPAASIMIRKALRKILSSILNES